ncbi:MAG TPA: BTAD domain-containing putative transcriptional regulator [Acidimicrobiia bacterium]|nr:BTAD domain-containing putative transcriptional regulator [Acidimicrobiia bacterium]
MHYGVLGPLEVSGPDGPIGFEGRRERAVLAALVLARGAVVSTARLLDAVWGDAPPRSAAKTVQNHVLRLRKTLGSQAIETREPGYRLVVAPDDIDADRFERLIAVARVKTGAGDSAAALESYTAARALWRGRPFPELELDSVAGAEATRLTELAHGAAEEYVAAALACGRHAEMIPELEAQVSAEPLREHRWAMLMLALYRSGRQADALRTYQRARALLGEELGIEPGSELRTLEMQIATQDVRLDVAVRRGESGAGVVTIMSAPCTAQARELVGRAGGEVVASSDDGIVVTFASAIECVRIALDIQDALRQERDGVRTGIGIHAGEPEMDNGAMPIDAIEAVASSLRVHATHGEIVVSDLVRDLVDGRDDYVLDEMGVVDLADGRVVVAYGVFDALEPPATNGDLGPPYKGLAAFGPDDAEIFFGRSSVVDELVARLRSQDFVALVGPSGSGKSSVFGAGLVAAVRSGALPGSATWPTVLITPTGVPLDALAAACATACDESSDVLQRALDSSPERFVDALRPCLARLPQGARFTLVIDQFEELFTLCPDANARDRFVGAIVAAATAPGLPMTVAIAIRADFFGHCASFVGLRSALEHGTMLLAPMDVPELLAAIDGPAALNGLHLEPGLSELVIRDLDDEPGALPLLSHAMLETWRRRRRRTLTVDAYLDSGGVLGAIARTAEDAYSSFDPDEQQIARHIFLRLAHPGDGTEDTRRRVALDELIAAGREPATLRVLQELAAARLITLDQDSVEVAHEAVIREWPRLRDWIDQDREGIRIHRHLTYASRDWDVLERADAELYGGPRLAMAEEWRRQGGAEQLNDLEAAFLDGSVARADEEVRAQAARVRAQARANRRLRRLLVATSVALGIAFIAGIFAWAQRQEAGDEAAAAQRATTRATVDRILAASDQLGSESRYLRALLLVEADRIDPSPRTKGAMFSALLDDPQLVATLPVTIPTFGRIWPTADGRYVIANVAGRLERWDVARRRLVERYAFRDVVAISGDPGHTLAVATADNRVRFIDDQGDVARVMLHIRGADKVRDIALSADGTRIAVVQRPLNDQRVEDVAGAVVLYDIATGDRLDFSIATHPLPVGVVAFSNDGALLASGSTDGLVTVQDIRTGAVVGQPINVGALVFSVALDPVRARVAVGSVNPNLQIWSYESGQQLASLESPIDGQGAYTPDGSVLAVSGSDAAHLYDADSLRPVAGAPVMRSQSGAGSVFITADGTLYTSGPSGPVTIWDSRRTASALFTAAADARSYLFPMVGGRLLAEPDLEDSVTLLDARTLRPVGAPLTPGPGTQVPGYVLPATFAASYDDSRRIAVVNRDGRFQLFDVATQRPLGTPLDLGYPTAYAVFSHDLRTIAVGGRAGEIAIIDVSTDQPRLVHRNLRSTMDSYVVGLAFDPGGDLYAADAAHLFRFSGVRTREPRSQDLAAIVRGANGLAAGMDLSADGRTLAISHNGSVQLYDTRTLQPTSAPIPATNAPIAWLAYSRDGRRIVVNDTAANVRLIDAAHHEAIGPLWTGLPGAGAVFSHDGRAIGTSTPTSGALLTVDPGTWRTKLCALAGRNLTRAEWHTYLSGEGARRKTCPNYP